MITSTVSQEWHGDEVMIQAKKVVGKSAYEIGLVVEGQAKELCPRNFGYLAASITTQSATSGTEPASASEYRGAMRGSDPGQPPNMKIAKPTDDNEVLVGTPVAYGPYKEFGTVRADARPFLRPALDMARGEAMAIVERNGRFEFKKYLKE